MAKRRTCKMNEKRVLNAGYVRLVEYMGGDESVIRNARRCWRSEDKSSERSDRNLIRHLLREGHMSPFERLVFTFDVKCPIFVARQWMRHRMCLSGDSVITFVNTKGETSPRLQFKLEDLYQQWEYGETCPNSAKREDVERIDELVGDGYSIRNACREVGIDRNTYVRRKKNKNYGRRCSKKRISNMNLRVLDEETHEYTIGRIEDVVYSGVQNVVKVITESGHTLKSTLNHRYYTNMGWLTLSEAYSKGAALAVSGYRHAESPKNPESAELEEEWRVVKGYGGKYQVSNLGRVRSWVDTANNILDKPVVKTLTVNNNNRIIVGLWNNGKGKSHQVSRLVASHFIPNPNQEPYVCHIDDDPTNNNVDNLYWGNESTNKRDLARNRGLNSSYLEFSKIVSLEYVGEEETYDISVDHQYHNFTANGFVVHNSSFNEESLRYCVAERDYFIPDNLDQKQLAFWKMYNDEQFDRYNLVKQTMPKEQARSILPLGTYTKFYWTVNGSSLMNFLKLRLDKGAQEEIRVYAKEILVQVKQIAPVAFTEWQKLYGVEDG